MILVFFQLKRILKRIKEADFPPPGLTPHVSHLWSFIETPPTVFGPVYLPLQGGIPWWEVLVFSGRAYRSAGFAHSSVRTV